MYMLIEFYKIIRSSFSSLFYVPKLYYRQIQLMFVPTEFLYRLFIYFLFEDDKNNKSVFIFRTLHESVHRHFNIYHRLKWRKKKKEEEEEEEFN